MKARIIEICINGVLTYKIERSIGNEVESIQIISDGKLIYDKPREKQTGEKVEKEKSVCKLKIKNN